MKADAQEALRAQDRDARALAQREYTRPLVLEAGAGTGKTATLVARIVTWCLDRGWQRAAAELAAAPGEPSDERVAARVLEGVVAITFTEAAAAEMAERVEGALREIANGGEPLAFTELEGLDPTLRAARAGALRLGIDRLTVQTIHAWCRALLRAHPLEAGLHPAFEVDPDTSVHRRLVREVLDEVLREAYGEPGDEATLELAAKGFGPGELEDALLALVESGVSASALAEDPLSASRVREAVGDVQQHVAALVRLGASRLVEAKGAKRAQETAHTLMATSAALEVLPGDVAEFESLCIHLQALWGEKSLGRLKTWGRAKFGKGESEALGSEDESFAREAAVLEPLLKSLCGFDPALLASLHAVLSRTFREVEARTHTRGVVTFQGLLEGCARLLARHPSVADRIRRDLDQLLVDEFQDTDARQCAIVGALALAGPEAERPGLFLVGDPKQSIYGWRSADLAAYEAFVARVEAEGGLLRRLSVNFRSVPAVLDEVDRVMPGVMQPVAGMQPAYQPLVASEANASREGFTAGVRGSVEHWIPTEFDADGPRKTLQLEANQLEARALARDLRQLHDEHGVAWKAVGVLFRSRGDWDVYLGALREADVPFEVEGDRSYYRRREIIDAAALVRCVLDPCDRLALVATLRCSAVGVPDVALHPLLVAGDFAAQAARLPDAAALEALREQVVGVAAALPADIPGLERIAGWEQNLLHFVAVLSALRESLASEAGDVFVERLRAATLFEVSEAGRFLGSWRAANLERFFCELAEELGAGTPVADVLRRLRHAVTEEEPRQEGRPRELLPDAVSILTVHGAKGLDFEHVYLMQLHKGGARRQPPVAVREVAGRVELSIHGAETLGFCAARMARERVEDFERVRLLYVGMTRAKQRLVMSWLPEGLRRAGGETLADLVERRAGSGIDLEGLAARAREQREAGLDRERGTDGLWVLPAHGDAATAPAPTRAAKGVIDPARVEADAAALEQAREDARLRMERPLGGRASQHGETPEGSPAGAGAPSPEVARVVGTAVHRVLEELDLDAAPEALLDDFTAPLAASLVGVPAAQRRDALPRAVSLIEALRGGRLLTHLSELAPHVVGRELPVLLPPRPEEAAIGFVAGSVDLLYRDPVEGRLVVVDYKTDRLADEAALAPRAAQHAAQGAVYQRAVQEALGLDAPPHFEVWFLAHDRALRLGEPSEDDSPSAGSEQIGFEF